ncbi:MAG: DUF362 domain-containing protein [Bacilli bacterium]|nr:DUF362 domain-containing protein [Bacilli bacterium]
MSKPIVYFTKEITPEALVKIYDKLGVKLNGNVGVKISTGEQGGNNYLHPELIEKLVNHIGGTIVECCTAYGGSRQDPKKHWKTIENHGFTKCFKVDILDEFGEFAIPVSQGYHLDKDIVGAHMKDYDSFLVLSHFKGHMMGGFGGALKNIAIGFGSTAGKAYIHSAGTTTDSKKCWNECAPKQDDFLESMADACQAILNYVGRRNLAYVSVANRLSVDCDCDSHPAEPEMADIGIFASLDPVALDQACVDAVYASKDPGKKALIERMESRHGIHTVEAAEKLGVGVREYQLLEL